MVPLVGGSQAALVKVRDHCSGPGRFEPVCGTPRNKRYTKGRSGGEGGPRPRNTSSTRRTSIPRPFYPATNELAINSSLAPSLSPSLPLALCLSFSFVQLCRWENQNTLVEYSRDII